MKNLKLANSLLEEHGIFWTDLSEHGLSEDSSDTLVRQTVIDYLKFISDSMKYRPNRRTK